VGGCCRPEATAAVAGAPWFCPAASSRSHCVEPSSRWLWICWGGGGAVQERAGRTREGSAADERAVHQGRQMVCNGPSVRSGRRRAQLAPAGLATRSPNKLDRRFLCGRSWLSWNAVDVILHKSSPVHSRESVGCPESVTMQYLLFSVLHCSSEFSSL
jgi:hypothetical protein